MQRLEVSGAVRPIYGSLGVKWLRNRKAIFAVLALGFPNCQLPIPSGETQLSEHRIASCGALNAPPEPVVRNACEMTS